MGDRREPINSSKNNPGPGNYEAEFQAVKQKAPGYKLGTSKRPEIKSSVPGAGTYENMKKEEGQKYTVG